ncbi:hypothetical protein [Nemorincola caseinilytica]
MRDKKRWKKEAETRFQTRMREHFETPFLPGDPVQCKMLLQYMEGKRLVILVIRKDNAVSRYNGIEQYTPFYVPEADVVALAIELRQLAEPLLATAAPTNGQLLPANDMVALYWQVRDKWVYHTLPRAAALAHPVWQQILATEKALASAYDEKRHLYERV